MYNECTFDDKQTVLFIYKARMTPNLGQDQATEKGYLKGEKAAHESYIYSTFIEGSNLRCHLSFAKKIVELKTNSCFHVRVLVFLWTSLYSLLRIGLIIEP